MLGSASRTKIKKVTFTSDVYSRGGALEKVGTGFGLNNNF